MQKTSAWVSLRTASRGKCRNGAGRVHLQGGRGCWSCTWARSSPLPRVARAGLLPSMPPRRRRSSRARSTPCPPPTAHGYPPPAQPQTAMPRSGQLFIADAQRDNRQLSLACLPPPLPRPAAHLLDEHPLPENAVAREVGPEVSVTCQPFAWKRASGPKNPFVRRSHRPHQPTCQVCSTTHLPVSVTSRRGHGLGLRWQNRRKS